MNLNKENTRHIRGLILFTVILFLGIQRFDVIITIFEYLWDLIFPFILGLCIAYILSVPMRFVERSIFMRKRTMNNRFCQKIKRPASILITVVLVLGVIAVVTLVVVPELVTTAETVADKMPGFLDNAEKWIDDLFVRFPFISERLDEFSVDWNKMTDSIVSFIRNDLVTTLSTTFEFAKNIISTLVSIGIALFFSIYVLSQKERLGEQVKKVLSAFLKEKTKNQVLRIADLADTTFSNFLSGQCIEAVILGTMFVVSMTILGFPYAVMIGVLIAFMALIPVFGAFIGCGVGTLLILIDDPIRAFWFLILFLALQLLEENLIYPHVVGNAVGLPAIWVLVAVTLGGSLFGVAGMLFFIPLLSVFYALFRELVYFKIKKKQENPSGIAENAAAGDSTGVQAETIAAANGGELPKAAEQQNIQQAEQEPAESMPGKKQKKTQPEESEPRSQTKKNIKNRLFKKKK